MTQCLNPHENLSNYEFSENEAKIYRPKYDTVTGHFLNLYENMGYLLVRGDSDKCFLDYGYSKENSKILHSFHKNGCRIASAIPFSIGIEYNMSLVLLQTMNFPTFISFCQA